MRRVSQMVAQAEPFLWNNFKMYLMQFPTCLLDLILEVQNEKATNPVERYKDFLNELEAHIGLGSYVNGQAAQFSRTPYITVNIQAIPMGGCSTRAVIGFDVVYSTDTPKAPNDNLTRYVGSSAESVADFRAGVMMALDELFYYAFPDNDERLKEDALFSQTFFDRLRGQTLVNPTNPNESIEWPYGIIGQVDEDSTMSEVTQFKREDRSSGLNLFHIVYKMDLNGLISPDWEESC